MRAEDRDSYRCEKFVSWGTLKTGRARNPQSNERGHQERRAGDHGLSGEQDQGANGVVHLEQSNHDACLYISGVGGGLRTTPFYSRCTPDATQSASRAVAYTNCQPLSNTRSIKTGV